jgi:hypothetical protein
MGAVASAARDHRDFGRPWANKPSDEVARSPACRAVVEADVGDAARVGDIGDQGHGRDAAFGKTVDGFPNCRTVPQRHCRDFGRDRSFDYIKIDQKSRLT